MVSLSWAFGVQSKRKSAIATPTPLNLCNLRHLRIKLLRFKAPPEEIRRVLAAGMLKR